MAELYSQYTSGTQFTAGAIVGSTLGVSGLNPIVDRINSVAQSDNHITGSLISGTQTNAHISGLYVQTNTEIVGDLNVANIYSNGVVSGGGLGLYGDAGKITGSPSASDDIATKNYVDNSTISNNAISVSDNQELSVGSQQLLAVTLGVHSGKKVIVIANFTIDWNDNAGVLGYTIQKDGVDIEDADQQVDNATGDDGAQHRASIHYFDPVGTGSEVYALRCESAGCTPDIEDIRLTAFEF